MNLRARDTCNHVCAVLLFVSPSLSHVSHFSSPVNTAGWLTGPLRALVARWIKRSYKKRLKGRRKKLLLKGGEEGEGAGPISWPTSNSQSGSAWRRAPELSRVVGVSNSHVTLGSGTGSQGIKGDVMQTQGPETYPSASAASINHQNRSLVFTTLLFVQVQLF